MNLQCHSALNRPRVLGQHAAKGLSVTDWPGNNTNHNSNTDHDTSVNICNYTFVNKTEVNKEENDTILIEDDAIIARRAECVKK